VDNVWYEGDDNEIKELDFKNKDNKKYVYESFHWDEKEEEFKTFLNYDSKHPNLVFYKRVE